MKPIQYLISDEKKYTSRGTLLLRKKTNELNYAFFRPGSSGKQRLIYEILKPINLKRKISLNKNLRHEYEIELDKTLCFRILPSSNGFYHEIERNLHHFSKLKNPKLHKAIETLIKLSFISLL